MPGGRGVGVVVQDQDPAWHQARYGVPQAGQGGLIPVGVEIDERDLLRQPARQGVLEPAGMNDRVTEPVQVVGPVHLSHVRGELTLGQVVSITVRRCGHALKRVVGVDLTLIALGVENRAHPRRRGATPVTAELGDGTGNVIGDEPG